DVAVLEWFDVALVDHATDARTDAPVRVPDMRLVSPTDAVDRSVGVVGEGEHVAVAAERPSEAIGERNVPDALGALQDLGRTEHAGRDDDGLGPDRDRRTVEALAPQPEELGVHVP